MPGPSADPPAPEAGSASPHAAHDRLHTPARGFLLRSAVVIAFATIASRVLGLGRETAITTLIGSDYHSDALYMAMVLPEIIRYLILSGVLSVIFIPLFAELASERGLEKAKLAAGQFLTLSLIAGIALSVIGSLLAPQIIWLTTLVSPPRPEQNPQLIPLSIELTRLMFPLMIFTGVSGIMQGILNSLHDYRSPAWAPIWFNLIFIVGMALCHQFWPSLVTPQVMCLMMIAGAALQALVQLGPIARQGVRWLWPEFSDPMWVRFMRLVPAAFIGYASLVTNNFVDRSFAFGMQEGSNTALWLASRVQQLPTAIFTVTLITALFPSVAQKLAQQKPAEAMDDFYLALRLCGLTLLPCMVFLWVWATPIVRVLFNHGKFQDSPDALPLTAQALAIYGLALFNTAGMMFTTRLLFAVKDNRTPVILGFLSVPINYGLDWLFTVPIHLQLGGVALSTFFVTGITFALGLAVLGRHFPVMGSWWRIPATWRVAALSATYALFGWGVAQGIEHVWPVVAASNGHTPFWGDVVYLLAAMALSLVFIVGMGALLKMEEIDVLKRIIARKRGGGGDALPVEG
ncbi:MAG: murein biosynthesis integral membrane protein MurJ [bacterium]